MNLLHEVTGLGPRSGVLIVGEAPGAEELAQRKPFVGPSGRVLRYHLAQAGLNPDNVRFENVIERKLEYNDVQAMYAAGLPGPELLAWYADLHARIRLIEPTVIVVCGDTALRAVLQRHDLKIGDAHCYVLRLNYGERCVPVVPVYHPAFVFRQPTYGHWLTHGLRKARNLAQGRAPDVDPDLYLSPALGQVLDFLAAAKAAPQVSIDVEKTMKSHELTCFGVAYHAHEGDVVMSIPLAGHGLVPYWDNPEDEFKVWLALSELLEAPNEKIFHNFIFDTLVLRYCGMETHGPLFDTMLAAHVLNPELPKRLDDLGRIYCYSEPWKQHQDWQLRGDPRDHWRYNALDTLRTLQISRRQRDELEARGLSGFFHDHILPLLHPVLETCARGIRIDVGALQEFDRVTRAELAPLEARLKEIANPLMPPRILVKKKRDKANDKPGQKAYTYVEERQAREFNPNSHDQVKTILSALGHYIPIKDGKETSSRTALLKIQRKAPNEFVELLLKHSKLSKLASAYTDIPLDEDGRVRFSYNVGGTKSGRFSATKTPWDTGIAIQTVPRGGPEISVRKAFVPDAGMELLQVDLSQAELRVVAWLAKDEKLTQLLGENADVHQYTANEVKRISGLECPRQLGKRLNHAANYGMGAEKFVDSCLLEADLVLSVAEARQLLDARAKAFPAIPLWQKATEREVRRTRKLVTPYGRERFFFGLLNDELFRDSLSFIPQSTVVDTLNACWITLTQSPLYGTSFNVLQQGHDSLLLQVRTEGRQAVLDLVKSVFGAQSFVLYGLPRVIPYDIKMGKSWGELHDVA